ncbi:NRDE family protein [Sphingobium nicotianae]|uniref:NRDE family protein n=1 Tax=Sphingobium nicotianae TaxID=2782607 RepID=A0A9X1IS91_9SPHN|nr:NRDE family protein [Sphingobium nicotianae]MBT2187920.1 NRDE family protein [Sphingobium nicotianae]
MCVLAFAWQAHPRWRLVMAGNRDELHDRPAAPLARWDDPDHVIAGRDLQAGGTWAGISTEGRFAVITNLRGYGPPRPGMASRGELVANLLSRRGPYDNPMALDPDAFNPFNLIVADTVQAHFLTGHPRHGLSRFFRPRRILPALLTPGIYGLSNGALEAPWPKTLQLKAALQAWLAADSADPTALFAPLRDEELAPMGTPPDEPSDMPQEALQSPVFIRNPVYGTRCSTIVAVENGGAGQIIERRFDASGDVAGEKTETFRWPSLIMLGSAPRL